MAVTYDLSGHRLLVVGASSGLGHAIGQAARSAGARVAFAARRRDRIEAAAAEAGRGAIAVSCDVTDEAACERAVEQTVAAFGGLDGLVYASGMSPLAMLSEAAAGQWRQALDTNLVGAALIARGAIPHLRASGGRALFISSYSVRECMPGMALYRVSKVALDALIECLRNEHPDVDITRVMVGNTGGTEFGNAWDPAKLQEILEIWRERNVFPNNTTMPLDVCAEAVVSVLAVRGYVDDIAVMSRSSDLSIEASAAANARTAE
jgi:NAD(P)-dependent dehydrogenase (short-subunit alcohol dehydrogenase family)